MRLWDRRIYPKNCSVLVAIPVTREDFFSDLQNERKDFVRALYLHSTACCEEKWRSFKQTADDVASLMNLLRKQGVNVISRATINELVAAQRKSKVIVLFAHWRSGELRAEDILWDRIGDVSMLPPLGPVRPLLEASCVIARRKNITQRLNEVLRTQALCSHPWFGEGPNQKPASEEHRVYLNRKVLDKQFPGVFGPNASVEFADGLVPIDVVANSFSNSFKEILDLSVCNSILLGELVKIQSPNCLVVATRLPASVTYQTIFYQSLFKGLTGGQPYIQTIDELRIQIRDFWRGKE